jgi:hypothetical protein
MVICWPGPTHRENVPGAAGWSGEAGRGVPGRAGFGTYRTVALALVFLRAGPSGGEGSSSSPEEAVGSTAARLLDSILATFIKKTGCASIADS